MNAAQLEHGLRLQAEEFSRNATAAKGSPLARSWALRARLLIDAADELHKLAGEWQPIETAPKVEGDDNEIVALWLDSRGDYVQVFVHYDASNDPAVVGKGRGYNHGFIGRMGNLYGGGGLKFWRHKFPQPAPPLVADQQQPEAKP